MDLNNQYNNQNMTKQNLNQIQNPQAYQPNQIFPIQNLNVKTEYNVKTGQYGMQNEIVKNQADPRVEVGIDTFNPWGSDPVYTICPLCKVEIQTQIINKSYNPGSICLSILCGAWCCIQTCRNKSKSCYDAIHVCPKCNHVLAKYQAC